MSDPVRELAEEIGEEIAAHVYNRSLADLTPEQYASYEACASRFEARLRAFLEEHDRDLRAQLARALGELAGLREAVRAFAAARDRLVAAQRSWEEDKFSTDVDYADAATRLVNYSASPLAEKAGEVIQAVGRSIAALDAMIGGHEVTGAQAKERTDAEMALCLAWDALQSELRSQPPPEEAL